MEIKKKKKKKTQLNQLSAKAVHQHAQSLLKQGHSFL